MPRNSHDNSLSRFYEVKDIAEAYFSSDNYNRKLKSKTLAACKSLDEPCFTIFKNIFFENKDNNWWNTCYSKTTFYRLRSRAINSFLVAYRKL